jgi:hypothetical protein
MRRRTGEVFQPLLMAAYGAERPLPTTAADFRNPPIVLKNSAVAVMRVA